MSVNAREFPFAKSSAKIHDGQYRFQVSGVHAPTMKAPRPRRAIKIPVVALVVDPMAPRDRTNKQLVDKAMGQRAGELAVTIIRDESDPVPAAVGLFDDTTPAFFGQCARHVGI